MNQEQVLVEEANRGENDEIVLVEPDFVERETDTKENGGDGGEQDDEEGKYGEEENIWAATDEEIDVEEAPLEHRQLYVIDNTLSRPTPVKKLQPFY